MHLRHCLIVAAAALPLVASAPASGASCKGYKPVQDVVPSPGARDIAVKDLGCGKARSIISQYMNSRVARDRSLEPKGWKCKVLRPGEDPLLRCHRGSKSVRWVQDNL